MNPSLQTDLGPVSPAPVGGPSAEAVRSGGVPGGPPPRGQVTLMGVPTAVLMMGVLATLPAMAVTQFSPHPPMLGVGALSFFGAVSLIMAHRKRRGQD